MRFLILNTDYTEFLKWLYGQYPGLEEQSYDGQMLVLNESLFGVADFYSRNLRKLGHEAWEVHVNNEFMQKAWAREHDIHLEEPTLVRGFARTILQRTREQAAKTPLRYLKPLFRPLMHSVDSQQSWFYSILEAQIKHYKPDVLLDQAISAVSSSFLWEMKPYVRLFVGQHGSALPKRIDLLCYDLIISLLPDSMMNFRQLGIPSELHRLAFEPRILSYLKDQTKTVDISFVGSLYAVHSSRVSLLEVLATRFKQMKIWGTDIGHLPHSSAIRTRYAGQAWGLEMYRALRNSAITLNCHGDMIAYAANMRLYEATGVGTLLITDWKQNLHEMFEPSKEVVTYHSPEECLELIEYYLNHEDERKAIARAGQERTLREHTYYHRAQELLDVIQRYLR